MKQSALVFAFGILSFIAMQYTFDYLTGRCMIGVMNNIQQRFGK